MTWWGKLLGGAFGFFSAGPVGAIVGIAAGHTMAVRWGRLYKTADAEPVDPDYLQRVLFDALFPTLGYVAKADGRVTANEIAFVEAVMVRMALTADRRAAAIQLFHQGKRPDFSITEELGEFKRLGKGRRSLLRFYVELLLQAAWADGTPGVQKRAALKRICAHLGVSRAELAHLEFRARAAYAAYDDGLGGGAARSRSRRHGPDSLAGDYSLLGISPSASDDDVKRAYRRLMNRHHPDKLACQNPAEDTRGATQRTQMIRCAYDRIRNARRARQATPTV